MDPRNQPRLGVTLSAGSVRRRGGGAGVQAQRGVPPPGGTADRHQTRPRPRAPGDLQRHPVPLSAGHIQARGDAQVRALSPGCTINHLAVFCVQFNEL